MHSPGSNPTDSARSQGLAIKDLLAGYNEMGCPDGFDKALPLDGEDVMSSWGDLKAIYH